MTTTACVPAEREHCKAKRGAREPHIYNRRKKKQPNKQEGFFSAKHPVMLLRQAGSLRLVPSLQVEKEEKSIHIVDAARVLHCLTLMCFRRASISVGSCGVKMQMEKALLAGIHPRRQHKCANSAAWSNGFLRAVINALFVCANALSWPPAWWTCRATLNPFSCI